MQNEEKIQLMTKRLIDLYHPVEIYLFGSYAWGLPDEDSDVDLLVVVDECKSEDRHMALVQGHRALRGMGLPKDLILLTKEEFDNYSADHRKIYYKIKNKGKLLYARA